ncbi:MAG: hypothetical protein GX868_10330 [Actinobacteria bacterium]|nr:hypothetical protein [Actinomycetota bacterium]
MTIRKHRMIRVVAASLLVSFAAAPFASPATIAGADTSSSAASAKLKELQTQRDRLRNQKANAASNVNVLQSQDADLEKALATLRANVESEASLLEDAEQAAVAADQRAQESLAAESQAEAELVELNEQIKEQARRAYAQGSVQDDPLQLLTENSLTDASRKRTYRSAQALSGADAVEHYRTIQANLLSAREEAQSASSAAQSHRAAVAERLTKLESAQDEHERLAAEVESRIERAMAEAASLESLDSTLAGQISSQQTVLANAVAKERAAAAARARAVGATTRPSSGGSAGPVASSGEITTVGGIRVHNSIAGNLQSLLNAASADGINFGGGGYRDSAGQIATRRNNCGSSSYAIYEMPSSSCSPPTARPGSSMHERGLAIDFTQGGRTLTRSSAGYGWLKANAAQYGFYNLPSEPWHWSTNGN